MHKIYEDTTELLNCEIEEISKKKELSDADVENLYKMVDIIKDFYEIDNMGSKVGYSGASYGMMPYWGTVNYDETLGRSGRSNNNYNPNGNSGRNYSRTSYGRNYDDEMRMAPERRMDW